MTINTYLEKIIERNPEQIITVYNRSHTIVYHGKADFAPLNLCDEYKNSHVESGIDIDGNPVTDLIINGDVSMTYRDKYKTFENYEKVQAQRWKSREVHQRDQLYGCIYENDEITDELLNKSFDMLMKMYENKVKSIEFLDNIIRGKTHSLLFRHMWDSLADTEVRS